MKYSTLKCTYYFHQYDDYWGMYEFLTKESEWLSHVLYIFIKYNTLISRHVQHAIYRSILVNGITTYCDINWFTVSRNVLFLEDLVIPF